MRHLLQRVSWFATLAQSRELTCLAWLHLLMLDLFQARYANVCLCEIDHQCDNCMPCHKLLQ